MLSTSSALNAEAGLNGHDYAELLHEHSARIYNIIYCMVGDEADAEDVTQEVFLKAFRSLAGFKGESNISTWLYRIAVNASSDFLRRHGRETRLTEPLDAIENRIAGNSQGIFGNPEKQYLKKELNAAIQKALKKLPVKYRTVLALKEIEECSYKQIGDILGISIGTVESRLFRAREMLKKEIITNTLKPGDNDEEM